MSNDVFADFRDYGGTIPTWLDYSEEPDYPELALWAVRLDKPWNGWSVPVVTGTEFRRWIGAWSVNDPNGDWDAHTVTEGDGALIYRGEREEPDVFVVCEQLPDGTPLYLIEGWTLVETGHYEAS